MCPIKINDKKVSTCFQPSLNRVNSLKTQTSLGPNTFMNTTALLLLNFNRGTNLNVKKSIGDGSGY